jgi:hypothetical protein
MQNKVAQEVSSEYLLEIYHVKEGGARSEFLYSNK